MGLAVAKFAAEGGDVVSRAGVGIVIDKLLTDESLRIRFALNRIDSVAQLCLRGVEHGCSSVVSGGPRDRRTAAVRTGGRLSEANCNVDSH
jgi:hypothetical protein